MPCVIMFCVPGPAGAQVRYVCLNSKVLSCLRDFVQRRTTKSVGGERRKITVQCVKRVQRLLLKTALTLFSVPSEQGAVFCTRRQKNMLHAYVPLVQKIALGIDLATRLSYLRARWIQRARGGEGMFCCGRLSQTRSPWPGQGWRHRRRGSLGRAQHLAAASYPHASIVP